MRAIQVTELSGPYGVRVVEVDEPHPGPGELTLDVHAAGVTFPEVLMTHGTYQIRPELPFIPGAEVAGVVRSAPDGSGFRPGDRVVGLSELGGYAEVATGPAEHFVTIPDGLSFDTAAGIPVNYLTVQFALTHRGRMQPGQTVLVHGAAGGVGTAAIQYAKALGATVVAVTSTDEKAKFATAAGADHTTSPDDFLSAVRDVTGGRGADFVVDPVGGERFTDSLRCLAPQGCVLVIGFTAGEIPTVKVNRLLLNNTTVAGVAWGAYALSHPGFIAHQWRQLRPLIADGRLDPAIGHTLPLADADQALALVEERKAVGKVVLTVR